MVADPLRRAQRQIALWLRPLVNAQPQYVTAFRNDSSIKANAKVHMNASVVLVADLEDFYGSISLAQTRDLFTAHGVHPQVSLTMARLCCVGGRLMQGGRASPFIANLIGEAVDRAVVALAPRCTYTRYVDDLTLSGDYQQLPTEHDLAEALASTGFRLRRNSFRVQERRAGAFITGLNVSATEPKIPRVQRRQMERFLHFAEIFGYSSAGTKTFKFGRRTGSVQSADVLQYVKGYAYWVRSIDESLGDYWLGRIASLNP
jgi:RNA-directed DNA polymerase